MNNLLIIVFLSLTFTALGQPKARNIKHEVTLLKNALKEHHVEPKEIDDDFSALLFEKLFDDLDPGRVLFTASDIASLERFRTQLDDEINGQTTGFLDQLKLHYRSGLERSQKLIPATMASLDWDKNEAYDRAAEWVAGNNELTDRHRQWLKFEILNRLVEIMGRDTIVTADFFDKNIAQAKIYVEQQALRPIRRLLKDTHVYDNEVSNVFLHAVAGMFDPHSDFFSASKYEEFVAALSNKDYYFGFMLEEDEAGNVVVSALAPGGSAWKSGALHVSDVLLSLQWRDQDAVDVSGMDINDVNAFLSESESDLLELTVRSVDGTTKKVVLKKEKMESDENVVQSFILTGPIKAGYIYLPDFYTRWADEQEGSRCANDVAKEIIRLKGEGIEGLILDLRFNGGGSLYEASAMGGIFIDEGPLAMMTRREKKPISLKDMNRGTVYDGPLIVMVNGASASASEVLAATIQDYNRGLIVGGTTYGKATGQSVFPAEGMNTKAGTGYVKVTTQRLYRVTGKSAQGVGIIPDVEIPDVFRVMNVKESADPFALTRDSVPKNAYFRPLASFDKNELGRRSADRVSNNAAFQRLVKTISWLEKKIETDSAPQALDWRTYLTDAIERQSQLASVDTIRSNEAPYTVGEAAGMSDRLSVDDYARELHDRWRKALTSDIYLQETYHILRDYISITKNP